MQRVIRACVAAFSGRGPQLDARIAAIVCAGYIWSTNGSLSQTSLRSPSPITVVQYGFFSLRIARY